MSSLFVAWVGNIPNAMEEDEIGQCIVGNGLPPPVKLHPRKGKSSSDKFAFVFFASEADRERFLAAQFDWPNGNYALIKPPRFAVWRHFFYLLSFNHAVFHPAHIYKHSYRRIHPEVEVSGSVRK